MTTPLSVRIEQAIEDGNDKAVYELLGEAMELGMDVSHWERMWLNSESVQEREAEWQQLASGDMGYSYGERSRDDFLDYYYEEFEAEYE